MDAITITFYRFLVAGLFVFLWLFKSQALPRLPALGKHKGGWLLVASLLLVLNYISNVQALVYIEPETSQVLMQVAPLLLMVGGVLFYKESFTLLQAVGAMTLVIGLLLFFSGRLQDLLLGADGYHIGLSLTIVAAIAWATYALMQKPLLKVLTAKQLTLLIYLIGAIVLLPFASLSQLFNMGWVSVLALLFCCLNTIVAYGAFTEALNIWQASKVGAVITLAPVFTFLSMHLAVSLMPEYFVASAFGVWAYVGAAAVVLGAAMTSLGKGQKSR
jgi:drug/metabolite transporter (DMT)-like permease